MSVSAHSLNWVHESPAYWDADKARIIGSAQAGTFDRSVVDRAQGQVLPNDWWRVEADGKTIGYGWMDVTWGDAEILLVVDPTARHNGVGSFILDQLEVEAQGRGLNYLHNQVSGEHPDHEEVTQWLRGRAFTASEDGTLARAIVAPARSA